MTFSIVALNGVNLGIGTVSGSVAVGSRVPWVKKEVGAIATQGYTEVAYGRRGLSLLEKGLSPNEALEDISGEDSSPEKRQVAIMDSTGEVTCKTGSLCPEKKNSAIGEDCVSIGNMLRNEKTVSNMVETYEEGGRFSKRILNAIEAGANAGGDRRGNRTAAIVVRGERNLDIEIDVSESPVEDLKERYEKRTR